MYFEDVLGEVYTFLEANPAECVVMSVKQEHRSEANTRSFEATFDTYVASRPDRWWLGAEVPALDDVRGKIVLVRRFRAATGKGIDGSGWRNNTSFRVHHLSVQDHYKVSDNDTKWKRVRGALEAAAAEPDLGVLHLNFSSGYQSGLFGIPKIRRVSDFINPKLAEYFATARPGPYGCVIVDFIDAELAEWVYGKNVSGPVAD
jgi:1-phosphatidylinositol phosphodiesterase